MKHFKILRFLIFFFILCITPLNFSLALEFSGEVSDIAVAKQSESVVVGRITEKIDQQLWQYDDQYNENGDLIPYEEIVDIYNFEIQEVLDGDIEVKNIPISIFNNGKEKDSNEAADNKLMLGETVAIGISLESNSSRPSQVSYNITHGKNYSAKTQDHIDELREWVTEARSHTEPSIDQELEDAYGDLGTFDEFRENSTLELPEFSSEELEDDSKPQTNKLQLSIDTTSTQNSIKMEHNHVVELNLEHKQSAPNNLGSHPEIKEPEGHLGSFMVYLIFPCLLFAWIVFRRRQQSPLSLNM